MYQSLIVAWISLIIYLIIVWKGKIVDKKERKWVFLLVATSLGCSVLTGLNISLHGVTLFLNDTLGRLSRMVVNI